MNFKKIIHLVILALFLNTLTACIPILIVGTGAVAGYSLSSDSAIGEVKCDYRSLWDITVEKLESMQAETSISNESKGLIKAKVSGYAVTVKIDALSQKIQKLKISARKHLLPKPQFAQKIFVKIVEDLK